MTSNVVLFPAMGAEATPAAGFWFDLEVSSLVGMDDLRRRLFLNRVKVTRGFYDAQRLRDGLALALKNGTHGTPPA